MARQDVHRLACVPEPRSLTPAQLRQRMARAAARYSARTCRDIPLVTCEPRRTRLAAYAIGRALPA